MLRPWLAWQATQVISTGGVIAYPTEAVYGLGAHPEIPSAVRRILQLKRRQQSRGLILVASRPDQITHYICDTGVIDWPAVMETWPGPVTWVFPASNHAPIWLTGSHKTIAIRISAHPLVKELCDTVGPIVSTSANPEGHWPARTAARVRAYFGERLDLVIPGAVGGLERPTEIRDAVSVKVLRRGN